MRSQDGNTVCCSRCGGLRVEYAIWHNPNSGENGEAFGSWNAGDNTYCADCDDNTDLVAAASEPQRFQRLRRKRIRQEREAYRDELRVQRAELRLAALLARIAWKGEPFDQTDDWADIAAGKSGFRGVPRARARDTHRPSSFSTCSRCGETYPNDGACGGPGYHPDR